MPEMRPVILYEAAFTFCANQSAHTAVRPDGPCQAATYIEGGGYQPAGSSIPYRYTRVSAGTTQVIAQGVAPITTIEALIVVYPMSG